MMRPDDIRASGLAVMDKCESFASRVHVALATAAYMGASIDRARTEAARNDNAGGVDAIDAAVSDAMDNLRDIGQALCDDSRAACLRVLQAGFAADDVDAPEAL